MSLDYLHDDVLTTNMVVVVTADNQAQHSARKDGAVGRVPDFAESGNGHL